MQKFSLFSCPVPALTLKELENQNKNPVLKYNRVYSGYSAASHDSVFECEKACHQLDY